MFNNKNVVLYVTILGLMACLSGVGYNLALRLQPEFLALLYVGIFYMPTPLYALLVTSKILKKPIKLRQYGTPHSLTARGLFTTIALFVSWIVLFAMGTYLLSLYAPDVVGEFAGNTAEVRQNVAEVFGDEAASSANLPDSVPFLIITAFAAAVASGFTINLLFALGEEYGWRGYLNRHLDMRFIKRNLVIGVVWGLWHAPLILQGYNYGDDYRLQGAAFFVVVTVMMSMILGYLVERFNNILYPAAFHGMFNGFVGIFPFLLGSYNPIVGGPVGLVAATSFCILFISTFLIKQLRISGSLSR